MELTQHNFQIYQYTDLLAFLEDAKESLNKTYVGIAEDVGVTSRTKVKKMFKGELDIPKNTLGQLANLWGLNKEEQTYLDLLRVFRQTNDAEMAVNLYGKMVELRKKHGPKSTNHALSEHQHKLLEKWYYLPIIYFLGLKGVESDAFAIAKGFRGKLSMDDVQSALKFLIELNLIKYTPEGRLVPVHEHVNLLEGIPSPLIKRFHSLMIGQAQEAIYGQPVDKRYLMSSTLNINKEMIPKIREKITQFMIELDRDFTSKDANSIYQTNIQFFNLAELREGEEN